MAWADGPCLYLLASSVAGAWEEDLVDGLSLVSAGWWSDRFLGLSAEEPDRMPLLRAAGKIPRLAVKRSC